MNSQTLLPDYGDQILQTVVRRADHPYMQNTQAA